MDELIQKYNAIKITDNQKEYIINLCDGKVEDQLPMFSEVVGTDITDLDQIPKNKAYLIINKLKRLAKPSERQRKLLETAFTLKRCSELLNRSVESYDDVSLHELQVMLQPRDRFPFQSRDTPIISTTDYEYGWQESKLCEDGKLYYLRFYDLLMIDFDTKDSEKVQEMEKKLSQLPETFRIYETCNGYHIFIVTRPINHKDPTTNNIMQFLDCDPFYIKFSYKNGYKIRLSPKLDRDEPFLAKYVKTIGNREHPECMEWIRIHDEYIEKFSGDKGKN